MVTWVTIYRFLLFPSSAARDDNAGRRSLSNLSWTDNVDVFKLYVDSRSSTPFLSLLFSYVRRRIVPTPPTSPSCRDERLRRVSFSSITNLGTSRPRPCTRPNLLCLLRFFSLRPPHVLLAFFVLGRTLRNRYHHQTTPHTQRPLYATHCNVPRNCSVCILPPPSFLSSSI